eukprot:4936247-Pleurochrysis_carterae.AAC.2
MGKEGTSCGERGKKKGKVKAALSIAESDVLLRMQRGDDAIDARATRMLSRTIVQVGTTYVLLAHTTQGTRPVGKDGWGVDSMRTAIE